MRRASRTDGNQKEIVACAQRMGATVQLLHAVGGGCPDLCIGYRGHNILVEVKDGKRPPSQRKLTPDQEEWHSGWKGQVTVVKHWSELVNLLKSLSLKK